HLPEPGLAAAHVAGRVIAADQPGAVADLHVGDLDGRVEQRVEIDGLAIAVVRAGEAAEIADDPTDPLGALLRAPKQLADPRARGRDRGRIVTRQLAHADLVVE